MAPWVVVVVGGYDGISRALPFRVRRRAVSARLGVRRLTFGTTTPHSTPTKSSHQTHTHNQVEVDGVCARRGRNFPLNNH